MYFDDLGTFGNPNWTFGNSFRMRVDRGDHRLDVRFCSDGLFIGQNSSTFVEVGTDIVAEDVWADWKFEVDASTPASATVDVYKNDILVQAGVSIGYSGSFTDGDIQLEESGYLSAKEAYVSSLEISATAAVGIVNQNVLLDGSESATNILDPITDGTFEINGEEIDVDISEDTLYEVLSKINSSGTGVTATWDDANDKIFLTVDEAGEDTITFGATDTSGFLDAMNIDTDTPTYGGVDAGWDREISVVGPLAAISDGFFNINDITFAVDTTVDSLQDILNEINDSAAGVSAYYQEGLDKVVLTSSETGENITFGNDTSNFITTIFGDTDTETFTQGSVDINGQTIAIDGNTFDVGDVQFTVHEASVTGATITIERDTETATTAIEDFIEKYNTARDVIEEKDDGTLAGDRLLNNIEDELRGYMLSEVSNTGVYDFIRDIGIVYSKGRLSLDTEALEDAFRDNPDSVGKLFGYDSDGDDIRDDGGLSNVMNTDFFDGLTSSYSGDITLRQDLIDSRIDNADDDLDSYEEVIAAKRARLETQYFQFADQVNEMNQQFSAFQAQLEQLNQLTTSLYGQESLIF